MFGKSSQYKKALKDYNKLIKKDFGKKVEFKTKDINKRNFEEQLYNAITLEYKNILKCDEDFKKEKIMLEANLYGTEARNYNFLIPIVIATFSFVASYFGILVNISDKVRISNTFYGDIVISCIIILLAILIYVIGCSRRHKKFCNMIAFYKLNLGIVNKLYDDYRNSSHQRWLEEEVATFPEKEDILIKIKKVIYNKVH